MPSLTDRLRHKVVPAVPVPYDASRKIDVAATRQYARWMAEQAVGAVAVWAHTGRGLMLTDAERALTLELWYKAMGDTPIVCGVGAPATVDLPGDPTARTDRVIEVSVALATAAKQGGASGVLIYPPEALRDLSDVDRRAVAVHSAVAEVGLPVIAFYLYEAAGGISYSLETIDELLGLAGVIGIKVATLDSVMTYQDVAAKVLDHEDALLITGEDRFLGYSLMLGAQAALVGMAAACTDLLIALLDAWHARDLTRFTTLAAAVDEFARVTFSAPMDGYVQRMLWALEADGVIPEGASDPFAPALTEMERAAVYRAVRALRRQ
ncbi:MAG: dihydrodipicolinate synthase family protein [Gemmatimonadota bacterium]|nr:MAG: dihydrodipicolinate synthase family protein [Gemmatimonadota bacterium]